MRYTVTWKPRARNQLATIWMNATDRQAVTDAANAIDLMLQTDPGLVGEARHGNTRTLVELPLTIFFDVLPDDCRVDVLAVRYTADASTRENEQWRGFLNLMKAREVVASAEAAGKSVTDLVSGKSMKTIRVGLVGSQFIAAIHLEALRSVPYCEVVAVCSATEANVKAFAAKHHIPRWFTDYRKMYELPDLDMVVLGLPNDLHCAATVAAAAAGKHVVCEKPLCLNLAEADRMIDACRKAGVKLMYAEELCFTPKYVRLKTLIDEGALGTVHLVKQMEKHDGPHAGWFWDVQRSGGGVTMDMGCHAIEFFRWLLGGKNKARIASVYADMGTYVHADKTRGEDNSTLILKTADGCTCIAEESWTKPGGMDDRAEVYGSGGVAFADLLRGNAIHTYSKTGYGYAVEKAGSTQGWSFTIYEEAWNYGFPQEMAHFVGCVRDDREPLCTGAVGKAVLEVLCAAYASAREGRRIDLPFATTAQRPIDLWQP